MRFYFQDHGQKVATKCIRVASDATVSDVIGNGLLHKKKNILIYHKTLRHIKTENIVIFTYTTIYILYIPLNI